jgi:hypothetical protein
MEPNVLEESVCSKWDVCHELMALKGAVGESVTGEAAALSDLLGGRPAWSSS